MSDLRLPTPAGFRFRPTVTSHGWVELAPFGHDEALTAVRRTLRLRDGTVVDLEISACGAGDGDGRSPAGDAGPGSGPSAGGPDDLCVAVGAPGVELDDDRRAEIRGRVRRVFGLDQDLAAFYELVRGDTRYGWVERGGEGRLLRSPTLWEDLAKILLTTNTTWAGTKGMVARLTDLGEEGPGGRRAFPAPARVAGLSPGKLDGHVRAGYRSPWLHELAAGIAAGEIDLASWEDPAIPSDELYDRVASLRGFGPYAAGTALKLLGRFDRLALDTVARTAVAEEFHGGQPVSDAEIRERYEPWGEWRGLVLWMDVLWAHRDRR